MIRRPPRSTPLYSSAASDVYKRQVLPDGRGEGRLGAAGQEPQGRDRRGVDRGLPRHGVAALRAGRAQTHRGQDRGRPGHREPEGDGGGVMGKTTIDRLIINSPYEEPGQHWRYERETRTFDLAEGRRPAGYVVASGESKAFDDPGVFVEIPLVNQIRPRVQAWRAAGYPGVSSITKRLLDHWRDPEECEARRICFCQLEAIETLVGLTEAPAAERVAIEIPGDGGE